MEKGKKNIDELFAEARKSRVNVSVETVARTLISGAAVTGATTAATAATVTGKSILTLSTPTIMTGTIVTAAAVTATTIAVVNNNSEEENALPPVEDNRKTEYVEQPLAVEEELPEEETISYQEALERPIEVEDVINDEEFRIEEEVVESAKPPVDQGTGKGDRIVLSSSDSKEEFDRKIQTLKDKGFEVDVDKVVLDGDKSKLIMNFVGDDDESAVCASISLSGPFEVVLEWDGAGHLMVNNTGNGSVNVVDTQSTERNGRSTVRVTTSSTKNSNKTSNTTQVITSDDGSTMIINSSGDNSDTVNIDINQLHIDIDNLMEDVNHQIEIQMENLEIQMENLFETLEEMELMENEVEDKKKEKEEKDKQKSKEEKDKQKAKEKGEKDGPQSPDGMEDGPAPIDRVEIEEVPEVPEVLEAPEEADTGK